MALPWVDFFWSWKRLMNRRNTPPAGAYAIAGDDTAIDFTGTANTTWTLPTPNGGQAPKKIKHKGNGVLSIAGTIYLYTPVTSLQLQQGDMVTLSDDGTYWSVGD